MTRTAIAQPAKTTSFVLSAKAVLQRKCACGNQATAAGECAECAKNKSSLQRKLAIGASNDPLELEADRVADQVMGASPHSAVSGSPPRIQRYAGQTTEAAATRPRQCGSRPCRFGQGAGAGFKARHGAALRS